MQDNHADAKYRRMTMRNLTRIQKYRVKRGKTGWSKFVLRALHHINGDTRGKWALPHIPPRTKVQFQLDDAKRRAKNHDDLVSMLITMGYDANMIATIAGSAA